MYSIHAKAFNLARRDSIRNENDFLRKSSHHGILVYSYLCFLFTMIIAHYDMFSFTFQWGYRSLQRRAFVMVRIDTARQGWGHCVTRTHFPHIISHHRVLVPFFTQRRSKVIHSLKYLNRIVSVYSNMGCPYHRNVIVSEV